MHNGACSLTRSRGAPGGSTRRPRRFKRRPTGWVPTPWGLGGGRGGAGVTDWPAGTVGLPELLLELGAAGGEKAPKEGVGTAGCSCGFGERGRFKVAGCGCKELTSGAEIAHDSKGAEVRRILDSCVILASRDRPQLVAYLCFKAKSQCTCAVSSCFPPFCRTTWKTATDTWTFDMLPHTRNGLHGRRWLLHKQK